jgi:hypothetical protein
VTAASARLSLVVLLALGLVACGDVGTGAAPQGSADAVPGTAGNAAAWQGVLACADCDGIDTRLRLQRGNGVASQYELVEAYLDGEGAEYFREQGRWRRDGRMLRLQPDTGGERLYAVDGAGNLVVVDRRGHAAGPGRVLSPVQASEL